MRLAGALALMAACAGPAPARSVHGAGPGSPAPLADPSVLPHAPRGWVRVADPRLITFRAPPDVRGGPVQGIDSQVAEYRADDMVIGYDLGWYSNHLCDDPVLTRTHRVINGRPGRVVTGRDAEPATGPDARPYWAAVYFPPAPGSGDALMIDVQVRTEDRLPDALALLGSVEWQAPAAGPVPPCPRLDVVSVTAQPWPQCPPAQGALRVQARLADGAASAGVAVVLTSRGPRAASETAITQDDGVALLCAAPGAYEVHAFAGDASASATVDLRAGATVTLALRDPG